MDENFIRIRHIFEAIEKIELLMKDVSREDFDDFRIHDVAIRELEIVGEASRNVSEDFQKQFSEIPWRLMRDLRNLLIHQYFGVNIEEIWKVIHEDLPELKKNISKILSSFS